MPSTRIRAALAMMAGGVAVSVAAAGCVPSDYQPASGVVRVAPVQSAPGAPAIQAPLAQAQAPAPQAEEFAFSVTEWSFTPSTVPFTVNKPITITLENRGNVEHDLVVPALGIKLIAQPGKRASQTVTASKEGTFELICSIPGHKEAGMKGTVVVSAASASAPLPAPAEAAALATSAAKVQQQHPSHAAIATTATRGNQPLQHRLEGDTRVFDVTAQHIRWEVLPGEFIDAYAYNGQVPGPILRVTEGDKVKINLKNELPEPTLIHVHGPTIPNAMDGVPDVTQKVVEPGRSFAYEFTAKPAGTFMYHTHHNSAFQEPKGLYGMFIIDPKTPTVRYDKEIFQVLGESGGYYLINGKAFPATEALEARVGERVLIRLVNLGQMAHPMHLHGHPFKIVGTDGHPVPEGQALTKDTLNIGPGERYDLLVELTEPGTWVFHCHILSHVQNQGVEPGGMITVIKVNPA